MTPRLLLTLAALAYCAASASAAISITGDFAAGTGKLVFDAPVSFTVTTAGAVRGLVFDDWKATDGTSTSAIIAVGTVLQYQINNGPVMETIPTSMIDHRATTSNAVSAGDTVLTINSVTVAVGDVFTIGIQTLPFNTTANFNPALTGIYGGTPLIVNTSNISLAGVPEPSATLLSACGMIALMRRRR